MELKDLVDITISYVSGRVVTYKTYDWAYEQFEESASYYLNDVFKEKDPGYCVTNPFAMLEVVKVENGHLNISCLNINLNNIESYE